MLPPCDSYDTSSTGGSKYRTRGDKDSATGKTVLSVRASSSDYIKAFLAASCLISASKLPARSVASRVYRINRVCTRGNGVSPLAIPECRSSEKRRAGVRPEWVTVIQGEEAKTGSTCPRGSKKIRQRSAGHAHISRPA